MNNRPDDSRGFCPVCGSPLAAGAQFCGSCGSHVPSPLNPYDAPTVPDGPPSGTAIETGSESGIEAGSESVSPTVPGIAGLAIETGTRCLTCGASNLPTADHCAVCGVPLLDMDASMWQSEPGRNGNQ
jgi:predicted amidophosphoribosyltransferase